MNWRHTERRALVSWANGAVLAKFINIDLNALLHPDRSRMVRYVPHPFICWTCKRVIPFPSTHAHVLMMGGPVTYEHAKKAINRLPVLWKKG